MRDFILSLRIRVKLLIAFGSILLLSVLLIVLSVNSIKRIIKYKAINENVTMLKFHLESIDLATKDFMYDEFKSSSFQEKETSRSLDAFQQNFVRCRSIIESMQQSQILVQSQSDELSYYLTSALDSLHSDFFILKSLLKKRGFKDYGLEGSLRKAIHAVENSGYEFDKVDMLTLRRHEKDFFLRKDIKYQVEFNNRFDTFESKIDYSISPALRQSIDDYRIQFNAVVDIEKQIGLKENEGLRGKLRQHFETIRPTLESFGTQIKDLNETQISNTQYVLWMIFSFQIVAGISMALVYANLLTKSIKEIRNVIQKLAGGIFPNKLHVRTTEEIGQTKMAFNQFIDRLKSATVFAEELGSGKLNIQYDEKYADDVLAQALIQAQNKLRSAEEHQTKINWINEGVASFNEILKNEAEAIELLSDRILKLLIQYLSANQGALYLLRKKTDDEVLERVATYAYDKKRFANHEVHIGDGIIGQCFLEGNTIYMKEVPSSFVKITSGLGAATPRNILIVPLKIGTKVMGIIEIASFRYLEEFQVNFIERIAESIASVLSNRQIADNTQRLLKESHHRTEVLAQQEEEMRQNAEELIATQEEMERQRKDMQHEIIKLKKMLAQPMAIV